MSLFPRVEQVINEGIERKLHTCVQIFISIKDEELISEGFGQAAEGVACDKDTVMLWRSAGKPLTAVAICKAWEDQQLRLQTPIGWYLPEITSKLRLKTIRQLLTHQSGLPVIDTGWPHADWDSILRKIMSIDPPEELDSVAAYQPQSSWFLLGEILRRIHPDQDSFTDVLQKEVLAPFGMDRTACGIPQTMAQQLPLPDFYVRERGELVKSDFGQGPWLSQPSPGGNLRGPISDLGRFYQTIWRGGMTDQEQRVLQDPTCAAMTSVHRRSKFDETLRHKIDMGLGFLIDSNLHGADTVPYGFSRHCSERTFGHGGSQCAMGFCDPETGLVVAWAANGFCGEGQHQRRNRAINDAIYEDLGFQRPKK